MKKSMTIRNNSSASLIFLFAAAAILIYSQSCSAQVYGISASYPNDEGIGSDPDVLFFSNFENDFNGWSYVSGDATIETQAANVHRGSKSGKLRGVKYVNEGAELGYEFDGEDEIYVRYYIKIDPDTQLPHHMGGISATAPGFGGSAGSRPPGDKGFWSSLEITVPLNIDGGSGWKDAYWYFYTYWQEMRSWQNPDGTGTSFYGNVFTPAGQTPVPKGVWICTEAMLKANTPGQYDGEQAFWIDGKPVGIYREGEPLGRWLRENFYTWGVYYDPAKAAPFEGYNWRTTSSLKINSIQIQWFIQMDHYTAEAPTENMVFVDDVVVARRFIGCRAEGDGPWPTPTPDPDDGDPSYNTNASGGCNLSEAGMTPNCFAFILAVLIIIHAARSRRKL